MVKADFNQSLPFKNETFEFVISTNTIEYLENPFFFTKECYRILKHKGKLLVETPNILNLKARIANLLVGFYRFTGRPYNEVKREVKTENRMNLQPYFQLRYNLHTNGFKIIRTTTHKFSNRAMLFSPIYPIIFLMTYRAFKKEKDPLQKIRNKEIFKTIMSTDLMFGSQIFIIAEKQTKLLK